jgi:6,7-dimethyl-8-ribityllumazine synthase
MREIHGQFKAPRGKIAIVAARFNDAIVDQLIRGAKDTLTRQGVALEQVDCFFVPGAYEIPFLCQKIAQTGRYAGVITLAAVVKGDTPHFDFVAGNCASGVMQASLKTEVPMTFGVITTNTLEQAIERAGTTSGNYGESAASALLELIDVAAQTHE